MKIDFLLTAAGSDILPPIAHSVHGPDTQNATKQAKRVAIALTAAGYNKFTLFDVRGDHVQVGTITIEKAEPLATFTSDVQWGHTGS